MILMRVRMLRGVMMVLMRGKVVLTLRRRRWKRCLRKTQSKCRAIVIGLPGIFGVD